MTQPRARARPRTEDSLACIDGIVKRYNLHLTAAERRNDVQQQAYDGHECGRVDIKVEEQAPEDDDHLVNPRVVVARVLEHARELYDGGAGFE